MPAADARLGPIAALAPIWVHGRDAKLGLPLIVLSSSSAVLGLTLLAYAGAPARTPALAGVTGAASVLDAALRHAVIVRRNSVLDHRHAGSYTNGVQDVTAEVLPLYELPTERQVATPWGQSSDTIPECTPENVLDKARERAAMWGYPAESRWTVSIELAGVSFEVSHANGNYVLGGQDTFGFGREKPQGRDAFLLREVTYASRRAQCDSTFTRIARHVAGASLELWQQLGSLLGYDPDVMHCWEYGLRLPTYEERVLAYGWLRSTLSSRVS